MRRLTSFILIAVFVLSLAGTALPQTEQELVNQYLKRTEKKHTSRISWMAVSFTLNRINRDNPYNSFANYASEHFAEADIPWLDMGTSFGVEFGLPVYRKFAWTFGGEYWLKLGTNQSGPLEYNPPIGTPMTVENLTSEVQTYGFWTGVQYFLVNAPDVHKSVQDYSVRAAVNAGYYWVSWDLWPEYENYNLATSTPTGVNTTFKGSAPGFEFGLGFDYPLRFWDIAASFDANYMILNFNNVAWYNSADEEVIVSSSSDADGRVDLDLSGFRMKIQLKRYFKF